MGDPLSLAVSVGNDAAHNAEQSEHLAVTAHGEVVAHRLAEVTEDGLLLVGRFEEPPTMARIRARVEPDLALLHAAIKFAQQQPARLRGVDQNRSFDAMRGIVLSRDAGCHWSPLDLAASTKELPGGPYGYGFSFVGAHHGWLLLILGTGKPARPSNSCHRMWSRRFVALATVVALVLPADGAQAATATAGQPIPPAASAGGAPDVLALPGGVVWLYTGSSVLRSTDNGASWSNLFPNWAETPTSLQVEGAYFLGKEDAWAVTDRQWPAQSGSTTIWRSTDGGLHWEKGVSLPGPLSYGVPGFDEFSLCQRRGRYRLRHHFGHSGR